MHFISSSHGLNAAVRLVDFALFEIRLQLLPKLFFPSIWYVNHYITC